ncbi:MAG: Fic family protein [Hymenobacter sp.]|nr:MAG: Fic family protein [Hymenobacter sp.]
MLESPPTLEKLGNIEFSLYGNPQVLEAVRAVNERYLYWTEAKHRPLPKGVAPETVWGLVKLFRLSRLHKLKLPDLIGETFSWLVTDATNAILHQLDMEMGGKLGSNQLLADSEGEKQRHLLLSSQMEEAITSSQLEGAATARVHAKEMLRKKRPPRDRSEQMIVNNYTTIQFVLQHKHEVLTPELLCEIQRRMTQNTMEDEADAGRFRSDEEVRVVDFVTGEIVHIPPPVNELPQWIQAFCDIANEKVALPGFVHPIIRASILHFLLGYIHPFVDGNGRTARAIFYWYLLRKNYWQVEYLSISRIIHRASAQYARAFLHTELDGNDLTYFINYQVRTLQQAFDSLQQYLQRKLDERKQLQPVRRNTGLNERQLLIVQDLIGEPHAELTIREIERRFNTAYATARADLQGLEEVGLLVAGKVGKQKILYFRAEDFDQKLAAMKGERRSATVSNQQLKFDVQ